MQPESKAPLTWVPELGRPVVPTQAAQAPGRGLSGPQTLTYGLDLAKNRAWAVATGLGPLAYSLLAGLRCPGLAPHSRDRHKAPTLSRDQECWESGDLSSSSSLLPPPSPSPRGRLVLTSYPDLIFPLKSP